MSKHNFKQSVHLIIRGHKEYLDLKESSQLAQRGSNNEGPTRMKTATEKWGGMGEVLANNQTVTLRFENIQNLLIL